MNPIQIVTEDLERYKRAVGLEVAGLKVRVISGICFALLMMGMVWLGGPLLAIGMCMISIIGYLELAKATKVREENSKISGFEIVSCVFIVLYYLTIYFQLQPILFILILGLLMISHMLIYVFSFPKFDATQVMHSCFSVLYAPVMLAFILMTRMLSNQLDTQNQIIGFYAVWMILISAWGSDTCAYFAGVLLGKHKITPKLSPKKTVEGCIGGVLGTSFFGFLYGLILKNNGVITSSYIWVFVLLGFGGSIAGQIGDLAASGIKRNYGIKDYGKCIPGHGGVMDRFDSVIFTAPLIYGLVVLFLG